MSPSAENSGIPLIGEFTSGVSSGVGLDCGTPNQPESRFCPQSTLYHLHRACASPCSTQVLILSLVFACSLPSSSSIRQLHAFFDLFIQKMIAQVSMSNDKEQTCSSQGIPSSSNQTQCSSTHPNVEQIWAAFAPSSTPQVIWPVRANHTSSARSNRKISNFPTTVLGLNNQTAKAESSSTCSDESNGNDDSDDELIELIGLYQTRYNAAQKHKVPRSEQKKKFAIIRRFLKATKKYWSSSHINGASRLRPAAALPNETLKFSPTVVLQKAKNQILDVFNNCSKFFATHDGRNCKKPK